METLLGILIAVIIFSLFFIICAAFIALMASFVSAAIRGDKKAAAPLVAVGFLGAMLHR